MLAERAAPAGGLLGDGVAFTNLRMAQFEELIQEGFLACKALQET